MRICDFCGETKPLTIETEPQHVYPEIRVICFDCVWKCVAQLVEHTPPPSKPAPLVSVIPRLA